MVTRPVIDLYSDSYTRLYYVTLLPLKRDGDRHRCARSANLLHIHPFGCCQFRSHWHPFMEKKEKTIASTFSADASTDSIIFSGIMFLTTRNEWVLFSADGLIDSTGLSVLFVGHSDAGQHKLSTT